MPGGVERKEAGAVGLAVVVVAFNSSERVEAWLDALERLGVRERLELSVVDSGSSEAERRFLDEYVAPRVDVLLHEANLGFGRACNRGAEATTAPTLLFTNPDTVVLKLPDPILGGEGTPGVVRGAMNVVPGEAPCPMGYRNLPSAAWEARDMLLGRFSRSYRFTQRTPAWVAGAALMVDRADFDAVGGFPEEIFLYFEDADICASHRERGGEVRIDPDFVVNHAGGASSRTSDIGLDGVSRWSGRIFAARHGGRLRAAGLFAVLTLYYVPRRMLFTAVRRARGDANQPPVLQVALDLLRPRRVLRRLGASV